VYGEDNGDDEEEEGDCGRQHKERTGEESPERRE